MNKKMKLKVGDWEICCNDMAEMLIGDAITATDDQVETFDIFINTEIPSPNMNWCPYCGVKIKQG